MGSSMNRQTNMSKSLTHTLQAAMEARGENRRLTEIRTRSKGERARSYQGPSGRLILDVEALTRSSSKMIATADDGQRREEADGDRGIPVPALQGDKQHGVKVKTKGIRWRLSNGG